MTNAPPCTDLTIVGAGPAGRLLARAAVARGLSVTVIDPAPERSFEPTYALFGDEVPPVLRDSVVAEWPSVRVETDGHSLELPTSYARLDSVRAHAALAFPDAVEVVEDRVLRAERVGDRLIVHREKGPPLATRRVVDASGHRPVLLPRPDARHEQLAVGGTLHIDHGLETPLFMDFRGSDDHPPSFLYALPIRHDTLFVEETILLTRERPSWALLEARLRARLERMGLQGELELEERCRIPMDPDLPTHRHLLAFGAAAGMVHPATGYQLGASAALADPFARQLAATLSDPLEEAVAAGWSLLWPAHRRHTRSMYLFGAEFLAELEGPDLQAFFEAFFQIPAHRLRRYLSHDAQVRDVAATMLDVYRRVPPHLRWALTRRGMKQPLPILRPLLGA